jgi:PKD repeat protein
VTVTVPWTAPAVAGLYPLTSEVDVLGRLNETREDDNTATRSLTVVVPVLPANFPATPIVDSFNRANGPLNLSWTGDYASASISANQFKPTTSAYLATVWNAVAFGPDQEAYVKITALAASSPRQGLLLKVQGPAVTSGAIEVRYDASSKQKKIYVATYQPGAGWQSRGSFSATLVVNDVLGARAKANGDVVVYRNGTAIGTVNVAAWSFATGGGRIGITLENAASSLLDNFGGGTLVGAAPPANHVPVASATATPSAGTAPLTVAFSSAGSSDPDGDPITYAWSFGNGQSSTAANPSITYTYAGTFVATLTVTDNRGAATIARDTIVVAAPPPSASFPATPMVDDFNRPDGAIGGAWTGNLAGLTVTSGELKCASTSYFGTVWNGAVLGATQEAFVKLTTLTSGAIRQGLLLKVQGTTVASGAIEVRYDASGKQKKIVVATCDPGGAWTNRGSAISVSLSRGDVLGARAKANGDVEVYRNGAKIGTVSVAAWAYATQGGRIGITLEKASSTKLDNFGGGTIAPAGAEPVALASGEVESGRVPLPTRLALSEAWPNPARESAEFALDLPYAAKVRTLVVDVQGRKVFAEAASYGAGHWTLRWRPAASHSRSRAGVYFARIDVDGVRFVRRVILAP